MIKGKNIQQDPMSRRSCIRKLGTLTGGIVLGSWATPVQASKDHNDFPIQIFSKHLQWLDYDQLAATVQRMGYDGIDLTVRPQGHVLPEHVERDLPKATEAIRKKGLMMESITTAITDKNDPNAEAILRTASGLGIKRYRMGWITYDKSMHILRNLDVITSKLKELANLNSKYKIRADYQNHAGSNFGSNPWELWYVLKNIPPEWMASRFDIRHAMVEGLHSWENDLRLLAPHIRSIDIKDFKWSDVSKQGYVENVPLGQGIVDFKSYFKLLEELKVTGPITVHCEYDLGGAEHGNRNFSYTPDDVILAIKNDLTYLRSILT